MNLHAHVPFDADQLTKSKPPERTDCHYTRDCQCYDCRTWRNFVNDTDAGLFGMNHDFGMHCTCPECTGEEN